MTTRGTKSGASLGRARVAALFAAAAAALTASTSATGAVNARTEAPAGVEAAARSDPTRVFLEARLRSDPDDSTAWNRLGALELATYRREGDFAALHRAERAAAESLRAVPAEANRAAIGLRARAALAVHRFEAAKKDAWRLVAMAPEEAEGWRLLAEARIELGDLFGAQQAAAQQERLEPGAPATELCLARMAMARGDNEAAMRRIDVARAQGEAMSPPDAELIAWCLVRGGRLAFSVGDLGGAETRLRAALAAWPGWYVAEDHLAETLAAKGDFDAALALYRPLAERLRRPEIWQAYGDVLIAAGKGRDAVEWYEKARVAYLASAEAGESVYLHHLAGFFSDVMPDPVSAVRWARRDLEERSGMSAWDALGRALHRAGQPAEALEAEKQALVFPSSAADAHVLLNAAAIFRAAGEAERGAEYRRAALAVNPRCGEFHVHR